MVGHYFSEPHDSHRAGRKCYGNKCYIHPAACKYPEIPEPARHSDCLNKREDYSSVACVLNYLLTPFLSLFLHLFKARHHNCEQLHDNACVDVRGHTECKYAESAECASCKEVQETQNAALLKKLAESCRVDTRCRHVRSQPVNEQRGQGKEYPPLKVRQSEGIPEGI